MIRRLSAFVGLAALAGGCAGERTAPAATALPRGAEPVNLEPAHFTTEIDKPFWPMKPGPRWAYR